MLNCGFLLPLNFGFVNTLHLQLQINVCINRTLQADSDNDEWFQEEGVEMWRCNNGECIALEKKRDGKPDCKDR